MPIYRRAAIPARRGDPGVILVAGRFTTAQRSAMNTQHQPDTRTYNPVYLALVVIGGPIFFIAVLAVILK